MVLSHLLDVVFLKAIIFLKNRILWEGYENALKKYFNDISSEWKSRGYKHNMGMYDIISHVIYPEWLGNNDFHIAHQSNLIRKKPEFYIPIFGNIPDNLEYIWPTKL